MCLVVLLLAGFPKAIEFDLWVQRGRDSLIARVEELDKLGNFRVKVTAFEIGGVVVNGHEAVEPDVTLVDQATNLVFIIRFAVVGPFSDVFRAQPLAVGSKWV